MNENVKRYEEHVLWKFLRWSGILVIILGYIYVLPEIINATYRDYANNNTSGFISGTIMILMVPIGIYLAIATFIEFYVVAVKVELHEDKIVGYPWYGKKRFEMRYDEIEIIKDRGRFPLSAITLLGKDNKMYMSVLVYPLAEVVEEIERRAVNLKESRLKWLKRDKSLWLYGKEDEKKVKNNGE
jgi:hypothetical protein